MPVVSPIPISPNGFIPRQDEKPYKVLLEIIVNRYKKSRLREAPPIRMSDLREDTVSLNNSIISPPKLRSIDLEEPRNQKEREVTVKIKLDFSDNTYDINSTPIQKSIVDAAEETIYKSFLSKGSLSPSHEHSTQSPEKEIDTSNSFSSAPSSGIFENSIYESYTNADIHRESDIPEIDSNKIDTSIKFVEDTTVPPIKPPRSQTKTPAVQPQLHTTPIQTQRLNTEAPSTKRDEEISAIVHQLVIEKYYETLKNFKQRSLKRQHKISEGDFIEYYMDDHHAEKMKDLENSVDSGLNCSSDDFLQRKSNTSIEISKSKEEIVEYDENKFLSEALGDELMNSTVESQVNSQHSASYHYASSPTPLLPKQRASMGESIGSSNISTLISTSEKSDAVCSLYSTVNKKTKKKHREVPQSQIVRSLFDNSHSKSYYDYEVVDDYKVSQIEDELIMENTHQREILYQISKALEICRTNPSFYGDDVLLEAEKIYLVAAYKKDVLNKELTKSDYEEIDQEHTSITLSVRNVHFQLDADTCLKKFKKHNWHFVCILDSGSTVRATEVVSPDEQGNIIFKDVFRFENLSSDVELNISLYAMTTNKIGKKKLLCQTFPHKRRKSPNKNASVESSFMLMGRSTLRNQSLNSSNFKLSKVPNDAVILDTFTSSIDVYLKLNTKRCGFLTIGTNYKGSPVWNRRWCVLEGSRFSYWNYPVEINQKPIGELDLLNCVNNLVLKAGRDTCSRPRTLLLEMKQNNDQFSTKEYFLSADNLLEMESWQRCLNIVLSSLTRWNNVNCYLQN